MTAVFLCVGCKGIEIEEPFATPTPTKAGPKVTELTEDANAVYAAKAVNYITLRSAPDLGSSVIMRIDTGQRIVCLGFDGIFMKVRVEKTGETGYVNGGYVDRVSEDKSLAGLSVVKTDSALYSYTRMQSDILALKSKYPDLLRTQSLTKTADGRDITLCVAGKATAKHKVLVTGSIHGREYMTTMLVMKQLERELFDMQNGRDGDVAFYVIPMLNPDGATISQYGVEGLQSAALRKSVEKILERENISAKLWKSNALGVDLNRNFDADWNTLMDDGPSALRYRGDAPFSEAETKAVKKLVEENAFSATVSYHESGSIIYWRYKQENSILQKSEVLGESVSASTGYALSTSQDEDGLEGGGLKDWALMKKGIPSLTIEVGCLDAPLEIQEWAAIWQRNRDVFRLLAAFVTGD